MSRIALPSVLVLVLAADSSAQRVVGYDGTGTGFVHEFPSHAPDPLCDGPSDPLFSFPIGGTIGTATLPGGAVSPSGDIGVNTWADTYWVTDGVELAEYHRNGVPLTFFSPPAFTGSGLGPITGLGVDTFGGSIWATDGTLCREFFLPATASGQLVTLAPRAPAFLVPGPFATDVEWDPNFDELWFSCATGTYSTSSVGAPKVPLAGTICPLGALEGVAVDTAAIAKGASGRVIYATDGTLVAHEDQGSAPHSSAKIYDPSPCFGSPPLLGLSYAARPNHYGAATACASAPVLETLGQSVFGSPNFAFQVTGATPGDIPLLVYSLQPLCPGLQVSVPTGCSPIELWTGMDGYIVMPPASGMGTSNLPLALPPHWEGLCAYVQAIMLGDFSATDALEVIVTHP